MALTEEETRSKVALHIIANWTFNFWPLFLELDGRTDGRDDGTELQMPIMCVGRSVNQLVPVSSCPSQNVTGNFRTKFVFSNNHKELNPFENFTKSSLAPTSSSPLPLSGRWIIVTYCKYEFRIIVANNFHNFTGPDNLWTPSSGRQCKRICDCRAFELGFFCFAKYRKDVALVYMHIFIKFLVAGKNFKGTLTLTISRRENGKQNRTPFHFGYLFALADNWNGQSRGKW